MRDAFSYVCSELVKIGKVSAPVTVHQYASIYEATWQCSCGATPEKPLQGLSISSAVENGKASYRLHCGDHHRGE